MEERWNSESEKVGFFDLLTNLPNRYFLYQVFPKFLQDTELTHSKIFIFIIDIDNFKKINDTYGHLTGDKILKEASQVLKKCIRKEDLIVRYGGDEFIILLQDIGPQDLEIIKKRIIEEVSKKIFKIDEEGRSIHLTVSGGFAVYPDDAGDLEELIRQADMALYFSKDKEKNRISSIKDVTQKIITQKQALDLFPCSKFIDREKDLNKLKEVFSSALASGASFVLVEGKFGIGKERLLDEFSKQISLQEVLCLKITALKKYRFQPYYAFSRALEDIFNQNYPLFQVLATSLPDEEIEALAGVIFHFANFFKNKTKKEKQYNYQQKERTNLFKGFRDVIVGLSRFYPVGLYIINLHWLDKANLELLNYFLNWEVTCKITICATLCKEELEKERDLECIGFLSEIKNKDNFFILELLPFSLEQSKDLVTAILPQIKAPEKFYQSLYQISEGNPLFLEECLKHLIESGSLFYNQGQWQLAESEFIDIPSSLEQVLKRRFRRLDTETQEMLIQAAVMGDEFQLEVMRQALKRNQGYIFELLDRARKKGFIGFKKQMGEFNFTSPLIQKAIYDDLDVSVAKDYHFHISQIIEELYKIRPKEAIEDLVYHYERTGDEAKIKEYKKRLWEDSRGLFNPEELSAYIEEIKQISKIEVPFSVQIKKIDTEISEEAIDKAVDLIRLLILALEKIKLYPQGNIVTEESINSFYKILKEITKEIKDSLTFSEAEGILLVNTQRLPSQKEKLSFIDNFISLLMEKEIKGLQFLPSIKEDEVRIFLNFLSQPTEEIRRNGRIGKLIEKAKIKNIKLDIARYERMAALSSLETFKEKAFGAIFLEFLGGGERGLNSFLKLLRENPEYLAQNLSNRVKDTAVKKLEEFPPEEEAKIWEENIDQIAKMLSPEDWQNYRQDIIRLLSFLEPNVKSSLVSLAQVSSPERSTLRQIITSFSEDEIVEIIMSSGGLKDRDKFLYNMQELLNRFAFSPEKRKKICSLLESRLKVLGLDNQELNFLIQKDYFKTLTLTEKIETICKISPTLYLSIGIENIEDLIEQLISNRDKKSLKKVIECLLFCLKEARFETKSIILELLGSLISSTPSQTKDFDHILESVFFILGKEILEEDSGSYGLILDNIRKAIEWLISGVSVAWERLGQLNSLISILYQIMERKEISSDTQKMSSIEEILSDIPKSKLIEILLGKLKETYLMKDDFLDKTMQDFLLLFRDVSLPMLINSIIETKDSSLESSNYRYWISRVLKRMGKMAIEEIKDHLLSEKEPLILRSLIELSAYTKEESLIDILGQFIQHNDPMVKKEAIFALSYINAVASKKFLLEP